MALGILEVINVSAVILGAVLIAAMFLRKKKSGEQLWICMAAAYALLLGVLAFTALPENDGLGRAIAAVSGIPALIALPACLLMKQKTAARICAAVSVCCELLWLLWGSF